MNQGSVLWFIAVFGGALLNGVAVLIIGEYFKNRKKRREAPIAQRNAIMAEAERAVAVLRTVLDASAKEHEREMRRLRRRLDEITSENELLRARVSSLEALTDKS